MTKRSSILPEWQKAAVWDRFHSRARLDRPRWVAERTRACCLLICVGAVTRFCEVL